MGLVERLRLFRIEPFLCAFFYFCFSVGDGMDPVFRTSNLLREIHPLRYLLVARRLGQLHELSDFTLLLFIQRLDVSITQRTVLGGVGFDLAALQRDMAELEYPPG